MCICICICICIFIVICICICMCIYIYIYYCLRIETGSEETSDRIDSKILLYTSQKSLMKRAGSQKQAEVEIIRFVLVCCLLFVHQMLSFGCRILPSLVEPRAACRRHHALSAGREGGRATRSADLSRMDSGRRPRR